MPTPMNWNQVSEKDLLSENSLLDLVETYAKASNLISSEAELSEVFRREVLPEIAKAYYGLEQYSRLTSLAIRTLGDSFQRDDAAAFAQAFNDWSDALCKEGRIHREQYESYCYVEAGE